MSYFLLFGVIIIFVLWIFQNFFLTSFYASSKKANVEKSANLIATSLEKNKNVQATIENIASYNSLSVLVYDTSSAVFSKKYSCNYANPSVPISFQTHEVYSYYGDALKNDGNFMYIYRQEFFLKDEFKYDKILNRDSTSDIPFERKENAWEKSNKNSNAQIMTHCKILHLEDGTECFLIVTSALTPLSNTVEIIKDEISVISLVFVCLAVLISIFASNKIAKPIYQTNKTAKQLAKKNYNVEFDQKGYLEVKELNDTLNYAKNELAATEKLQKELIANISHDLRTPLTMITGYGEVMRDLPGENTPENIQIIIDEATRLSNLVNDLLDLSKLQAGSVMPEKNVFCLTDSIEAIFSRYSKLKEQDGYNIGLAEYSEKVYVNADELKISQVIYNLVNNAINYVGEDKTVIVTQEIMGKKVRISVTDHGEGIPAEKLQYIWDRYYKVDKEHRRSVVGTGLGLSIVKSILDAHNAHYGVKSVIGRGSTFWFELDIHKVKKVI